MYIEHEAGLTTTVDHDSQLVRASWSRWPIGLSACFVASGRRWSPSPTHRQFLNAMDRSLLIRRMTKRSPIRQNFARPILQSHVTHEDQDNMRINYVKRTNSEIKKAIGYAKLMTFNSAILEITTCTCTEGELWILVINANNTGAESQCR